MKISDSLTIIELNENKKIPHLRNRGKIDTPITHHVHDHCLIWLGTGTSIKLVL